MKQLNWYQIFGKSNIPDGRTVLPTDDIQIWLNCADIWDKTYTTLAEVLADTDTLSALIASNNAVDYMVRSTTWAASVALVPTMTSNTTPSGVASASSAYEDRPQDQPYHAFDGSDSTAWSPDTGNNSNYLQYTFEDTKSFYKFSFTTNNRYTDASRVDTLTVSIGETEETLTSVYSYSPNQVVFSKTDTFTPTSGKICRVTIAQSQGYKYCSVPFLQFYSASITADSTAMTLIGANNYAADTLLADATWLMAIAESEYIDSVLNVKVPTMTDNTHPSGEASTSSAGKPAWKAFDGDITSLWNTGAGAGTNAWIKYRFEDAATCIATRFWLLGTTGYGNTAYKIQGSNDNNTWTDLYSGTFDANAADGINNVTYSNTTAYEYMRVFFLAPNISGTYAGCSELQFYGREDV